MMLTGPGPLCPDHLLARHRLLHSGSRSARRSTLPIPCCRLWRSRAQGDKCAVTVAAKICDFFGVAGVALPQLSATWPDARVEMPKVSPGQTDELPNAVETWNGADSQPRPIEKVRTYCAYPAGLLSDSQPT